MTFDQAIALLVLVLVVGALIWNRIRSDVVALTGAAALLATGVVRPVEVQAAFASPALLALASLFVIAYALELSGLMGLLIRQAVKLCSRIGSLGVWIVIVLCGAGSAFLNNTPIVVLAAPVVRDVAQTMKLPARRYLIPLSYATILGGACTLIGTSTNLLVNDMARNAGQPTFGLFDMTPVAVLVAIAGGLYLYFFGERLLGKAMSKEEAEALEPPHARRRTHEDGGLGDASVFDVNPELDPYKALTAALVFLGVVSVAALGIAPIAAVAFAGAVLLILLGGIRADEAYRGLRPDVLLLIAGMVVIGIAMEVTGLAEAATGSLIGVIERLGPWAALALLYGVTLFLTEVLSNAAVAVLLTPVAVALAESLGVSPRPFLIGVMLAASYAFATPFGYQTNVLVYKVGNYSYMDFVRVGLPLNLVTWAVAVAAIPTFYPF